MATDPETTLAADADTDAGQQDTNTTVDVDVDEILVEEVSIDGLCGVY